MLFFIPAHDLKVCPAMYGKVGEVIIRAVRDFLEANYSHFLGITVIIIMEEASSALPPVFFVLLGCFSLL